MDIQFRLCLLIFSAQFIAVLVARFGLYRIENYLASGQEKRERGIQGSRFQCHVNSRSQVCGSARRANWRWKILGIRSTINTPEIVRKRTTCTLILSYFLWILGGKARVLSGTSTSENFSQSINTHVSKVWAKHIGNFILCWEYFSVHDPVYSCYIADRWITLYDLQQNHAVV